MNPTLAQSVLKIVSEIVSQLLVLNRIKPFVEHQSINFFALLHLASTSIGVTLRSASGLA